MTTSSDAAPLRLNLVSDGTFRLDGGAMFGVVPRVLWEKVLPPDESNRVELGLNCLLVRGGDRILLLETGVGEKRKELMAERYRHEPAPGLMAALAAAGVKPAEVTDVVNSHLHWDHAGGNTCRRGGGLLQATFPQAIYHVQRGELAHAREAGARGRGSYMQDDYEILEKEGRLALLDGEAEIMPGVTVHPAPGHLPHMQVVLLQGRDGTVFFPADLIPTRHHLAPAWVMGFDVEPELTVRTKDHWLRRCAAGGWRMFLYHEAGHPWGLVGSECGP
ncbi:MAG: MBL fold metallo-hydrolase, partial [Acidobacteriota bacterium]